MISNAKIEQLEPRLLLSADLIGIVPEEPIIRFNNTGTVEYNAGTQQLDLQATPLEFVNGPTFNLFFSGTFEISALIDNTGTLVSGVVGNDLEVNGSVDVDGDFVPDFTGLLLTGEVTGFDSLDTGTGNDKFAFTFEPTGGQLASYYAGETIGVNLTSEQSNFVGLFTQNFNGGAKGDLGVFDFPSSPEPASLGNFVWFDNDRDGIQDDDEDGVAGVTATLTGGGADGVIGNSDDTTATTTTDADGFYTFENLNPDEEYKVTFSDLPTGYQFTDQDAGSDDTVDSDADTTNGMTPIVTLAPGEFNDTLDAGVVTIPASLGDYVWHDNDGDGVQDANEDGVEGVTVTLTGGGENGEIGDGDDTTATTATDADGLYLFDNLIPGTEYKVTFSDLPTGFQFTNQDQGSDDAADSDADTTTGMTPIVTLAPGEFNDTLDAGILQLASLGDFVWHDTGSQTRAVDGIQQSDEDAIAGVLVNLLDDAGNVIESTTTDANGFYLFDQLWPGDYATQVDASNFASGGVLEGWYATLQNAGGDDAVDSDGDRATYTTALTNLVSGEFDPTLDFGFFTTGIQIEKTGPAEANAGDTITYSFTVINTGDVPLSNAQVDDELLSPNGDPIFTGTIGAGETVTFTRDYVLPATGNGPTSGDVTIDFDTDSAAQALPAGTIIDDEWADLGITVTTDNPFDHPAMIFDSANPTGGDRDLGAPNSDFGGPGQGNGGEAGTPGENSQAQGKILIISEDRDQNDPDDNAGGGTFIFTFDSPVTVNQVNMLDIDGNEPGGTLTTYDAAGNVISTRPLQGLSDNSFQEILLGDSDVSRMEVDLISSGAITDLILGGDSTELINEAAVTADPVDPESGVLTPVSDDDDHVVNIIEQPPSHDCSPEGLTPGYWRQPHHFDDWQGLSPYDKFEDVFNVNVSGNPTLHEAVTAGGGGENALMRHAVAALLNANHDGIEYAFTADEVIVMVQQAFWTNNFESTKDIFEAENERGGDLKPCDCDPHDGKDDDKDHHDRDKDRDKHDKDRDKKGHGKWWDKDDDRDRDRDKDHDKKDRDHKSKSHGNKWWDKDDDRDRDRDRDKDHDKKDRDRKDHHKSKSHGNKWWNKKDDHHDRDHDRKDDHKSKSNHHDKWGKDKDDDRRDRDHDKDHDRKDHKSKSFRKFGWFSWLARW